MKLAPYAISLLLTAAASAQNLPPKEVLLRYAEPVQTPLGLLPTFRPEMGSNNSMGGHAWDLRVQGAPGNAIWGSRLGEPESILRWPQTIAGIQQEQLFLGFQGLDDRGQVTYAEDPDNAMGLDGARGLWIEDERIVQKGDPVLAMPGFHFRRLGRPIGTFGNRLAFAARIGNSSTGEDRAAFFLGHDQSPLIQQGDLIGGLPVDDFFLPFSGSWVSSSRLIFSPSGNHWIFSLQLGGVWVLMVDGELATFEGVPLVSGTPAPASLAAEGVDTIGFSRAQWIDDEGDWGAIVHTPNTIGAVIYAMMERDMVRESGALTGALSNEYLDYVKVSPGNQARLASTRFYNFSLLEGAYSFSIDGYPSDLQTNGYDLDGDGLPDTIYAFGNSTAYADNIVLFDDSSFISIRTLGDEQDFTVSDSGWSLIRVPGYQLGTTYCTPAVANSTGNPARLVMAGSSLAGGFALSARAFNLPVGQPGYFLAGTANALISMPGGSQGNLCLAGDLARFASQVGVADDNGIFEVDLDSLDFPFAPPGAVEAGTTLYFQGWFRDLNPTPTSNFTDAVEVTFD